MVVFNRSVLELIRERTSVRSYTGEILNSTARSALIAAIEQLPPAPFGSPVRFELAAAFDEDRHALRDLGTYGFIRGATAFIIGATQDKPKALTDFGFLMEILVLAATDLNLGTCWLGGFFTRSSFTRKISAKVDEIVPAVCAVGIPQDRRSMMEQIVRKQSRADNRQEGDKLFFKDGLNRPLLPEEAGVFTRALEMVRLGPSASNKQPWRVTHNGDSWDFYLQRTPGYRDGAAKRLKGLADMQRVDMGIAMCHFALTAAELGLPGGWMDRDPSFESPESGIEYIATWEAG